MIILLLVSLPVLTCLLLIAYQVKQQSKHKAMLARLDKHASYPRLVKLGNLPYVIYLNK